MTKTSTCIRHAEVYAREQVRLLRLIKRIAKGLALALTVAILLTFLLSFTKAMPFFYKVTEDSVTVTPGDTLWVIAEENMGDYPYGIRSYVAEIRRLNGMGHSSDIVSGESIRLPVYRYILG